MSPVADKRVKSGLSLLLSALVSCSLCQAASAQQEGSKSTNHRQLALSLPKVPQSAASVKVPVPGAVGNDMQKREPELDFVAHPAVLPIPAKPENNQDRIKEILIDGASRAEVASRSYNRRVADLIVWFANSMKQPGRITPVSNQSLRRQLPIEPEKTRTSARIVQID